MAEIGPAEIGRRQFARAGTATGATPGNTFHTTRLLGEGAWVLGGSTEWPDMRAIAASVRDVVPPGGPR
jgi:hypothetical protein